MEQMQEDYKKAEAQRQEEMHVYLERIDALQAKLTYLAKETVAAAKEANAATGSSLEKQLAEKDEKIALLMEEGEKLSKIEMQRLQTIKKLRAKAAEDEKMTGELRKRLDRAEASEADLKAKLRKAQVAERQASEKIKQIATIEKQVDELKVDRENAAELVRSLTAQLKEAKESAARAAKEAAGKATEAEKAQIANLQNELEDAQIEKKLAEDRAAAEIKKYTEESDRQREKFAVQELELKNEIHGLESRLEAMRARLEESSTTTGAGDGESAIKLMRQVETLQQQYALAKSNWETIEGSLNARVAALEKERDETSKRETETRKKARDAGARSRRAEEDLENANDQVKSLERELQGQQEQLKALASRVEQAEIVNSDSKADFERQRKLWESELASRLEEEKIKWRRELAGPSANLERLQSPTTSASRKASGAEFAGARTRPLLSRLTSHDLAGSHTDSSRPSSAGRRSNVMPTPSSITARALASTPTETSPGISRRESTLSFDPGNIPPTPSIEIDLRRLSEDGDSSPQRTIADLVSTSTAGPGAGPSVQLVDRLSGLVRKLESEKASFKDELRRLTQQRDEARSEVVDLMREGETKGSEKEMNEMNEMNKRYEASLEILGEREEEIEDLKDQINELKSIYKELVETKVGGGDGKALA
ncbi:TATA element modulatory factor [Pseudocercospora fuligena]|uniref:TATA element modulatory factor n=1 Tax=Pseudocercospora fuligena TaxID=685502 RepID=A0A8H6VEA1_9PEZI|nr:TATA element modulatory factor [Pseudocercospora fuligena]